MQDSSPHLRRLLLVMAGFQSLNKGLAPPAGRSADFHSPETFLLFSIIFRLRFLIVATLYFHKQGQSIKCWALVTEQQRVYDSQLLSTSKLCVLKH